MKSVDVKKFVVVIIQSLPAGELKTGDILRDEVLKYKQLQEPDLSVELHPIQDKSALIDLLVDLEARITRDGVFPILHLETHGGDEGVQLASGEMASWPELLPYFRVINVALANQLVLMLAMCIGISIIGIIPPDERAPFNLIVCAAKEVPAVNIRDAFTAFYDHYFFSFDLTGSVDKMNQAVEENGSQFYIIPSSAVFDGMLDPDRDPRHFAQMVDEQAVKEKATHPQMKKWAYPIVRKVIERKILRIFKETAEQRDHYIMRDIKR